MGQYWKAVNLDKKEYLDPWTDGIDTGAKLIEQLWNGTGDCLLVLLAAHSELRGGGDWEPSDKWTGRWAGDRVIVAGDYAEPGEVGDGVYEACNTKEYTNIGKGLMEYIQELKS